MDWEGAPMTGDGNPTDTSWAWTPTPLRGLQTPEGVVVGTQREAQRVEPGQGCWPQPFSEATSIRYISKLLHENAKPTKSLRGPKAHLAAPDMNGPPARSLP